MDFPIIDYKRPFVIVKCFFNVQLFFFSFSKEYIVASSVEVDPVVLKRLLIKSTDSTKTTKLLNDKLYIY